MVCRVLQVGKLHERDEERGAAAAPPWRQCRARSPFFADEDAEREQRGAVLHRATQHYIKIKGEEFEEIVKSNRGFGSRDI